MVCAAVNHGDKEAAQDHREETAERGQAATERGVSREGKKFREGGKMKVLAAAQAWV
jgi:hypothetical protein